jgi:hypothetical protein
LGVSAEKVVATIETPSNHHGIFRPERKKLVVFLPAFLEEIKPIDSKIRKKMKIISQSMVCSIMAVNYLENTIRLVSNGSSKIE